MSHVQPAASTAPISPSVRRGVVIMVSDADRLLVIRRSAHVVAPRKICFPGGHIEPGESEEEAVVREFREELGGAATPGERLWRSISPRGVQLAWWTAHLQVHSELTPNAAEVEEFFWCGLKEMATLPDLLDSNWEFLAAVTSGEIPWSQS